MEKLPHSYLYKEAFMKDIHPKFMNVLIQKSLEESRSPHSQDVQVETIPADMSAASTDFIGGRVGYDRWALSNLEKELSSADEIRVSETICSLCDLAYNPEHLVEMIRHDIHSRLVPLMKSGNHFIRVKTLICWRRIAGGVGGRDALSVNQPILVTLFGALRDPDEEVRKEAALTVHFISENFFAVQALINAGGIGVLIKCILEDGNQVEVLERQLMALEQLLDLNDEAKVDGLAKNGLQLQPLLSHPDMGVRVATTTVFSRLLQHPIGKVAALKNGLIQIFMESLKDQEEMKLIEESLKALMFASIPMEGRREIAREGGVGLILSLLSLPSPSPSLLAPALRTLTSLAELSPIREELNQQLPLIRAVPTYGRENLSRYLETLINTILCN